jgi:hypothetical protein
VILCLHRHPDGTGVNTLKPLCKRVTFHNVLLSPIVIPLSYLDTFPKLCRIKLPSLCLTQSQSVTFRRHGMILRAKCKIITLITYPLPYM